MRLLATSVLIGVASAAAVGRRDDDHWDDDWSDPYDHDYRPDVAASVSAALGAQVMHHWDDDWLDPHDHNYRPDIAASISSIMDNQPVPTVQQQQPVPTVQQVQQQQQLQQHHFDDDWLDPHHHNYRPDIAASVSAALGDQMVQHFDDDWLDPNHHNYRPDVAASISAIMAGQPVATAQQPQQEQPQPQPQPQPVPTVQQVQQQQQLQQHHFDDDWLDPHDHNYRPDIAASVSAALGDQMVQHWYDDWLDPNHHNYRPDVAASISAIMAGQPVATAQQQQPVPTVQQQQEQHFDDDWLDPYDHDYRPDVASSVSAALGDQMVQHFDDDWLDPYDHEYRPDVAASISAIVGDQPAPTVQQQEQQQQQEQPQQQPEQQQQQQHFDDDWLDPYDDEYRPDVAASVLSSVVDNQPTPETIAAAPEPGTTPEAATMTQEPPVRAAANPTYCPAVLVAPNSEERSKLSVLFKDRLDSSEYAEHVVGYASRLVSQIDMVGDAAERSPGYGFTTAFDNVDVAGILGLASAAPIYTCYLSSLWDEALKNPQRYAKRAPSEEEKIKLIVLFERREQDGVRYSYADALESEADDLVDEVQNVAAAAASADPNSYSEVFARVDVPFLLSVATQAPVYTEGLSSAFEKAASAPATTEKRPESSSTTRRATTATAAAATTKGNYVYYTQVEDGKTRTFSVEIQTRNEGVRRAAAVGGAFAAVAGLLL